MSKPLCSNCHENKLELAPLPHDYHPGKSISLLGYRLFIYRDKPETIDNLCGECLVDRAQANEAERIYPALDDAYQKGYEAGQQGS